MKQQTTEKTKDYFNRSTLEVARSFIDNERITTRSPKYLSEEKRLAFLSVWTAFNVCFAAVAEIYEDENTSKALKERLEGIYLGIPTGFNLPLENRVPPEVRTMQMKTADENRQKSDQPGPIIINGYNDPDSLEMWKKEKEGQ